MLKVISIISEMSCQLFHYLLVIYFTCNTILI